MGIHNAIGSIGVKDIQMEKDRVHPSFSSYLISLKAELFHDAAGKLKSSAPSDSESSEAP